MGHRCTSSGLRHRVVATRRRRAAVLLPSVPASLCWSQLSLGWPPGCVTCSQMGHLTGLCLLTLSNSLLHTRSKGGTAPAAPPALWHQPPSPQPVTLQEVLRGPARTVCPMRHVGSKVLGYDRWAQMWVVPKVLGPGQPMMPAAPCPAWWSLGVTRAPRDPLSNEAMEPCRAGVQEPSSGE